MPVSNGAAGGTKRYRAASGTTMNSAQAIGIAPRTLRAARPRRSALNSR
jgi:hypothetical protein